MWPAVLLSDSCIKQVLEQGKDAITVCRTVTCATCRPVQTRSRKHHAIPRNYLLRRPHTLRRRHRPSARARTGYLTIPGQRRRAKKCGNLRYNPEISSPAAPYPPPQTNKFPRKFPESKNRTATEFPKEFSDCLGGFESALGLLARLGPQAGGVRGGDACAVARARWRPRGPQGERRAWERGSIGFFYLGTEHTNHNHHWALGT